ncbi:MAG: sugar ABC transporter substrate-binding protein [Anaerolineae bacterium]
MSTQHSNSKMNRREFLRLAAVGGAGLATTASGLQFASARRLQENIAYIRFLTQETDPAEVQAHRNNIRNFEAAHADMRVELQLTGAQQIVAQMIASLNAGVSSLDVLQPNPATAFGVAAQDMLLPIDDLVEDIGGDAFFYGDTVMRLNGVSYGVPFAGGTVLLWYRKDLFEADGIEIPTTWEELEAVARHFTKQFNPDSPTDYGIGLPYSKDGSTAFNVAPFWWSNGADYFDKDLNIAFESDETAEFLDWYGSMYQYVPPAATGWSWGDLINTFLSGQSAMTVYLGRVLSRVYSNAPQLVGNIGVFPYPKRKLLITQDDPNYLVINAKTAVPDASKEFVKYLITGDVANEFLCTVPGHLPPATQDELAWWSQTTTGCQILDENPEIKQVISDSVAYANFSTGNAGGVLEAVSQGLDRVVRTGIANPMQMIPDVTLLTLPSAIQEVVLNGKSGRDAMLSVVGDLEQGVAQMKQDLNWGV